MMKFNEISRRDQIGILFFLGAACILGGCLRGFLLVKDNFPLNDGGLFFTMTHDLIKNDFRLPVYTSYNQLEIPFAYPPLPFYLAGFIILTTHVDIIEILRFLPLFFSILSIPAYFLLAEQLLEHTTQALHATLAFAILSPVYLWQIMGGGLTRSPAFFFSIVALWLFITALKTNRLARSLWAALFLALTAYCHLEILLVTMVNILIITYFLGRSTRGIFFLAVVAFFSMMLISPYLMIVISRHGIEIFEYAFNSGNSNWIYSLKSLLFGELTTEYLFTPFLIMGILGLMRQIRRKEFLLTIMLIVTAFVDPRNLARSVSIPLYMLSAVGIDEILLPGISGLLPMKKEQTNKTNIKIFPSLLVSGTWFYILIRVVLSSQSFLLTQEPANQILSQDERAAMAWIRNNITIDSNFLVLSSPANGVIGFNSEWFPALTQRRSLNTSQGTEWLPRNEFQFRVALNDQLTKCVLIDVNCLERIADQSGSRFSHIYLAGALHDRTLGVRLPYPLESSLRSSNFYQVMYEQRDVIVFRRLLPLEK